MNLIQATILSVSNLPQLFLARRAAATGKISFLDFFCPANHFSANKCPTLQTIQMYTFRTNLIAFTVILQSHKIVKAAMTTTTKQEVFTEKLYEIPQCTICLQQLSENMATLDCGHVFHLDCINQHFQYRGTCPLCQKRAYQKEIRPLHYLLSPNTQANSQLSKLLANLDTSEVKKVELLLIEVKNLTETVEKMKKSSASNDKDLKNQSQQVINLREEVQKKKNQIEVLRKENVKLDSNWKGLSDEVNRLEKNEIRLRIEMDKFKECQKDLDRVKKLKKMMNDNSQEIIRYRTQLEIKGTPLAQLFSIFFDMLLMKNLEFKKINGELAQYPSKIQDKEFQITKMKGNIDNMSRNVKEANEKRANERKKYDELKAKYRILCEKAKMKGVRQNDIPEMEDSQGFANLTKNYHVPEDLIIQNTSRKPMFSTSSTIGGLLPKKKDDRMKIFN